MGIAVRDGRLLRLRLIGSHFHLITVLFLSFFFFSFFFSLLRVICSSVLYTSGC